MNLGFDVMPPRTATRKTAWTGGADWDAIMQSPELKARWAEVRSLASEYLSAMYNSEGIEDGIGSSDVNHTIFGRATSYWDGSHLDVDGLVADFKNDIDGYGYGDTNWRGDYVGARKNADLAPSAETSTCVNCGKTIGKSRASSGADLWVAEGNGGVNCVNANASISGGHQPATTASRRTAGDGRGPGSGLYDPIGNSSDFDSNGKWCEGIGETPNSYGGCARCYLLNAELSPGGYVKRHNPVLADGSVMASRKTAGYSTPGYYVVSRTGAPFSGPYATFSEAEPAMIAQRGATVQFIGLEDDPDWAVTKPKPFPANLNTVNGSKKTAGDFDSPKCIFCGGKLVGPISKPSENAWGGYEYLCAKCHQSNMRDKAHLGSRRTAAGPGETHENELWSLHGRGYHNAEPNPYCRYCPQCTCSDPAGFVSRECPVHGDMPETTGSRKTAGWWSVSESNSGIPFGNPGQGTGHYWGDSPADIIDNAVAEGKNPLSPEVKAACNACFVRDWGRDMTDLEWGAGTEFAHLASRKTAVDVNYGGGSRMHGSKTAEQLTQPCADCGEPVPVNPGGLAVVLCPKHRDRYSSPNPRKPSHYDTPHHEASRRTAGDVNYGGGPGSDDPGIELDYVDAGHKAIYNGLGTDGTCEICGKAVLFDGFGPGDHTDPNTEVLWKHVKRSTATRKVAEDQAYCRGCGLMEAPTHNSLCWQCKEKRQKGQSIEWRNTNRPKPKNHKAILHTADSADWDDIDWNNYERGHQDGKEGRDISGEPDHGQPYLDGYHDGQIAAEHFDALPPARGSMQSRYADTRRITSTRHFADEADEISDEDLAAASDMYDGLLGGTFSTEEEKAQKGLGGQVDPAPAPLTQIQTPNPISGQDGLPRVPANLYQASLMIRALDNDDERDYEEEAYLRDFCPECNGPHDEAIDHFTPYPGWMEEPYPEDYHDQLDDEWNNQPSAGDY